jgi:regulatory protein
VAYRLLARRDYFAGELGERLRSKGFSDDEIDQVLAHCAERGFLDDEKLARRFAELRAPDRGWGPRRIEAELRRRGVADGVAAEASSLDSELLSRALATALRRAERRAADGWWRLHERRARMVSSVVSRGFDVDDATRSVAELAAERKRQHHARHDQPGDPLGLP